MPTGDFPCSVCGHYWCSGVHHIVPCAGCNCYPCACKSWPQTYTTTTIKWPPDPERLHKDDIEAIAKRVVELLAEKLK